MNYEKFTIKAQDALNAASAIAQKEDHSQLETEHLPCRAQLLGGIQNGSTNILENARPKC